MYRYILFLTLILSLNLNAQNFEALTSRIFFNIDLKNHDTTLLSELRSKPGLVMDRNDGWTSYPPTTRPDTIPWYRSFSFSSHPYFLSEFNTGNVAVYMSRQSPKVVGVSLSLSFKSAPRFDSVYSSLKSLYRKYSSKVINRPNLARPYEETKYLSANGKDYVIIATGKGDAERYIYVAYNYQGYDW